MFQTNLATSRDAIKDSGGGTICLPDYVAAHGESPDGPAEPVATWLIVVSVAIRPVLAVSIVVVITVVISTTHRRGNGRAILGR